MVYDTRGSEGPCLASKVGLLYWRPASILTYCSGHSSPYVSMISHELLSERTTSKFDCSLEIFWPMLMSTRNLGHPFKDYVGDLVSIFSGARTDQSVWRVCTCQFIIDSSKRELFRSTRAIKSFQGVEHRLETGTPGFGLFLFGHAPGFQMVASISRYRDRSEFLTPDYRSENEAKICVFFSFHSSTGIFESVPGFEMHLASGGRKIKSLSCLHSIISRVFPAMICAWCPQLS